MVSERGIAQTIYMPSLQALCKWGRGTCRGVLQNSERVTKPFYNRIELENRAIESESLVSEIKGLLDRHPSNTEHVKFRTNPGRPRSKAKHIQRPIEKQYREGKVKSTPGGE